MHIKATTVAYAFSVQCFENTIIVPYAVLRVNYFTLKCCHYNNYQPLCHCTVIEFFITCCVTIYDSHVATVQLISNFMLMSPKS